MSLRRSFNASDAPTLTSWTGNGVEQLRGMRDGCRQVASDGLERCDGHYPKFSEIVKGSHFKPQSDICWGLDRPSGF